MPTTPTTTPTIIFGTNIQRKKKGKDFTKDEDIGLVEAYLGVTNRPEVGDDMTDETMWSLIKFAFITKTGDPQYRNTTSLKSRFNYISSKCQYFSVNYAKVMAQPHSGENDNDMVS